MIPEKVVYGLLSLIPEALIDAGIGPGTLETLQNPSRSLIDKIILASVVVGINIIVPVLIVFGKEINEKGMKRRW